MRKSVNENFFIHVILYVLTILIIVLRINDLNVMILQNVKERLLSSSETYVVRLSSDSL